MATPQRIPVQDFFRIKTPSMTVTITAEDLQLPPLSAPVPVPGNLVTIDPNPETTIRTPQAAGETSPKMEAPPVSPSFAASSTEAPAHRPSAQTAPDAFERRESHDSIGETAVSPRLLRRESSASVVFGPRRSTSKHADALYGKFGAPPPIQPLEAEVEEECTPEGIALTRDKTLESQDYTYWDKLRRRGTRTEIRRWHTYVPEGEEETAFFGRSYGVDVPVAAHAQGVFYKQQEEEIGIKEYRLPTRSYVAPAIWVRRTKGSALCDCACQ